MATSEPLRHSHEEWAVIVDDIYKSLPSEYSTYPCPAPQSAEFAKLIDHTLLKLDATPAQIDKLCEEAKEYGFKTVCVRLDHVPRCTTNLKDTDVDIACVVDFHQGTSPTAAKVQESLSAVSAGAKELDLVLPHPMLHTPDQSMLHAYPSIYSSIHAVRTACPAPRTTLKVILETSQLTPHEIVAGSVLAIAAGADFVKTSTGFLGRGASVEDVRVMRAVAGNGTVLGLRGDAGEGGVVQVKASGGIRTMEDVVKMVEAGAGRIGASAGVAIMEEAKGKKEGGGGGTMGGLPEGHHISSHSTLRNFDHNFPLLGSLTASQTTVTMPDLSPKFPEAKQYSSYKSFAMDVLASQMARNAKKAAAKGKMGVSVRDCRDGTFELIPPRHRKKTQAVWEEIKAKEGIAVRDFASF